MVIRKTGTFLLVIVLTLNWSAYAQTGGNAAFGSLAYYPNARIAALGGSAIAIYENDINLASQNPALLRPTMSKQVGLSHAFHLANIQSGCISYGFTKDSNQTFGFNVQYFSYGSFKKTAANGEDMGTFTAGDYALGFMYSKRLDPKIYIGIQAKVLYSSLEVYNSVALAMDIGLNYHNPTSLWTASLLVSNVGKQLKSYTDENSEDLPFNVQVGVTKKLKNAPFRFSVVANHLEKPGQLIYENLNKPSLQKDLASGEIIPENIGIGAKTMSHLVVGSEVILGRFLYGALSYNYLRRWEMGLKEVAGGAGFSWGFGIKLSRLHFSYARATFLAGSATDHISLILFFGKK